MLCKKIEFLLMFGFVAVGQDCIQNGVNIGCKCADLQICRHCFAYSDSAEEPYLTPSPFFSRLRTASNQEQQQLPFPLLRLYHVKSLQEPPNILSSSNFKAASLPETSLYPSQEYEKMIFGSNYFFQEQPQIPPKIPVIYYSSSSTPPSTSGFDSYPNSVIEMNSFLKDPKRSDKILYQKLVKLEAQEQPVVINAAPLLSAENEDCKKQKLAAEMKKKSEAALALSLISPTISGAGLAVGLINFFRPNPVVPQIEKLREEILAKLDKIDREISSNLGLMTIQSGFFSEVEVKMNSLRKHYELYLNEPNQAQTEAFKSICMDPAYHPITLFGAAESFLSFKKMDLQLQNDLYSNESYEKIETLYRNIYDELILLYGYCEAVVNGPGDENITAKRTKIAENMDKNVNLLLDDLNQRRMKMLNSNENSNFKVMEIV